MEVKLLSGGERRTAFAEWHAKFIEPRIDHADSRRIDEVFARNASHRSANATLWLQHALKRCDAGTCFLLGKSESALRVSRAALEELRALADHSDLFFVSDDENWSAAISGFNEWGPFVMFSPDDTVEGTDTTEHDLPSERGVSRTGVVP